MKSLIKELTEVFGPSGREDAVRAIIRQKIAGHIDDVRTDALGNLIAHKKANSQGSVKPTRLMIAAHMDEVGVIVSHADEKGFLRFHPIGGVSPLTALGGRVVFADGAAGVIGREKPTSPTEFPSFDKMYIDVGAADKARVQQRVGDIAAFTRPFVALGDRLIAKAFDDRIGCAVMVQMIQQLKQTPHDLCCVFTVQEEVGVRGAITSGYGVEPDVALAVDVTTTGDTPEAHPMAVALGLGPAIKVKDRGMLAHPGVKDWMVRTAEALDIPYQLEILEFGSTDAAAIQISRSGVAAGCLSIPCRYIHSPSEMVDLGDVEQAVKLLLGLVEGPLSLT